MTKWFKQTLCWLWHLDTRAVEIVFGQMMLARGVVLIILPDEMSGRSYQWFLDLLPIRIWALGFLLFGVLQIAGVVINGRWRKSPLLRLAALFVSMFTYAVMTTGFIQAEAWLAVSLYGTIVVGAFWCLLNVSVKN